MDITPYHGKYFAYELTKRVASDNIEKLTATLLGAQVDLNPHQIEAALFAFRSPLSKGAILVKLPSFFKIVTPIGNYNSDWAIVKHYDETIYLVRENKSSKDVDTLRNSERDKIKCGRAHFAALETNFAVATTASEI